MRESWNLHETTGFILSLALESRAPTRHRNTDMYDTNGIDRNAINDRRSSGEALKRRIGDEVDHFLSLDGGLLHGGACPADAVLRRPGQHLDGHDPINRGVPR